MPLVNIRVAGPGLTEQQKADLIRGVTDVIVETLHRPAELTMVIIDELDPDGVGLNGRSVSEVRRSRAQ